MRVPFPALLATVAIIAVLASGLVATVSLLGGPGAIVARLRGWYAQVPLIGGWSPWWLVVAFWLAIGAVALFAWRKYFRGRDYYLHDAEGPRLQSPRTGQRRREISLDDISNQDLEDALRDLFPETPGTPTELSRGPRRKKPERPSRAPAGVGSGEAVERRRTRPDIEVDRVRREAATDRESFDLLAPGPTAAAPASAAHEPRPDRRVNVWVTERPTGRREPLVVGETYTLNIRVGEPVAASLVAGPETRIPSAEIPERGLHTAWVVSSATIEIAPGSPGTEVSRLLIAGEETYIARFRLTIPKQSDSPTVHLRITPRAVADTRLHLIIYAYGEVYRRLDVRLVVAQPGRSVQPSRRAIARVSSDMVLSPPRHLGVRPKHEWQTPPGRLSITVVYPNQAHVSGTAGGRTIDDFVQWSASAPAIAGSIRRIRTLVDELRAAYQAYLDNIVPSDLEAKVSRFEPSYDWRALSDYSDDDHRTAWTAVECSKELQQLAFYGYALYDQFFPRESPLRGWVDALRPGHRIDITWLLGGGADWMPHVPWGLLYRVPPPSVGSPIDPLEFLGLRFRIDYTAYRSALPSRALGALSDTYRACCLYWGKQPDDETAREALWQQGTLRRWDNHVFVPEAADPDPKTKLVRLLANPSPSPMRVLYLFCQSGGSANDPLLRFGSTPQLSDVIRPHEIGLTPWTDRPLVFLNSCTSAAADPYFANELEHWCFQRACGAYIGTEAKVPIQLASRFAFVFFQFFYREMDKEAIAAGEALAQARLFLWTRYRNIGGLFYSYVNEYELFMATDAEVEKLPHV